MISSMFFLTAIIFESLSLYTFNDGKINEAIWFMLASIFWLLVSEHFKEDK